MTDRELLLLLNSKVKNLEKSLTEVRKYRCDDIIRIKEQVKLHLDYHNRRTSVVLAICTIISTMTAIISVWANYKK